MKRVTFNEAPHGIAATLAVFVLVLAVFNLNIPYFALAPGPTRDVTRLIQIDGTETNGVNGRLLLTTVSLRPIRVADAVRGWLDDSTAVVSRAAIIPPGESEQDVRQRTSQQMTESQLLAAAAALGLLGLEVRVDPAGARILDVLSDGPAARVLRRGDVIVGAAGGEIRTGEELKEAILRHGIGERVSLIVLRDDEELTLTVRTVQGRDNPLEPMIGIRFVDAEQVELPLAIEIDSLGIGGPSAGLMFAVAIVDLIDEADHVQGRVVAGTGEIAFDGRVGPVGGVRQKIEAAKRDRAELFLVPFEELEQACSVAGALQVVGIESLVQAIAALDGDVPGERTCG